MSKESRNLLLELWRDEANDHYIRHQAFSLWAATHAPDDLEVIHSACPSMELADSILRERLIRGDRMAIPEMIGKIRAGNNRAYWWHFGRYLWSPELTDALDETFRQRRVRASRVWGEAFQEDEQTHEMIMRLPIEDGERLLIAHWDHLRFAPAFVQTALYVATPRLLQAAQITITECPLPARLMEHLSLKYGIRVKGHLGLRHEAQVRVLAPYLHLLKAVDIGRLWDSCNDHGWFAVRRELLDSQLQPPFSGQLWDRGRAAAALDKMISDRPPIWMDHWIDSFLKTGIPWREILSTLAEWANARQSYEAFRILALAVEHSGSRNDLAALKAHQIAAEHPVNEMLDDIEFAVRRRTIH